MPEIKLLALSAVIAASTSALAAPLSKTDYATLTGPDVQTVDFQDLQQQSGSVYFNDVIMSNGVQFGERFAGQQLTANGGYDALGSSTTGGKLNVVAGAAEQNLLLDTNSLGNTRLLGLSSSDGEFRGGSVSMLFSSAQSSFGFQAIRGASGTSDITLTVKFFGSDGSLIDSQVVSNPFNSKPGEYVAFSHGVADIRGVSIEQSGTSDAFVYFDNIKFGEVHTVGAVPEPETYALMLGGLSVVGFAAKRRRRGRAA